MRSKGRHPARAAAAAVGTALALAALAPAPALAETKVGTTQVTMAGALLAKSTVEGHEGEVLSNVAVTVPTSLPVSVDAVGAVTAPEGAYIANYGQNDVRLSNVRAEMLQGFTAADEDEFATSDASNLVSLAFTLTSGQVEDAAGGTPTRVERFTLKDCTGGGRGFDPAWVIKPVRDYYAVEGSGDAYRPDTLAIDDGARMAHLTGFASGTTAGFARIHWTFESAE